MESFYLSRVDFCDNSEYLITYESGSAIIKRARDLFMSGKIIQLPEQEYDYNLQEFVVDSIPESSADNYKPFTQIN